MVRSMYDSTRPDDIPRDAEMVAFYVDGRYAWPQAWLDLFPASVKVSISAVGTRTAQVGDVEAGCIWPPANAVDWVLRARLDGYDPTIYVNERNDWEPTRRAFLAADVPEPHWWVANYDGSPSIPTGAVAKQYAHPPMLENRHYDLSAVADHWPGVDAPREDDMPNISQADLNKLLDAADKLTHEFRVSDGGPGDVRPDDYPATRPDDVVGHTLTLRAWQDRHIGLNRSMNDGIARIETVVNQLVTAISQLQVSGQTQEGFDALFRTSTLTPGLLREGAVFVDNDNPNPPTGG